MYVESLTTLKHRLEDLVLALADKHHVPYSVVKTRCKGFIDSLLDCWIRSLDWDKECRVEQELLEECIEELSEATVKDREYEIIRHVTISQRNDEIFRMGVETYVEEHWIEKWRNPVGEVFPFRRFRSLVYAKLDIDDSGIVGVVRIGEDEDRRVKRINRKITREQFHHLLRQYLHQLLLNAKESKKVNK